MPLDPLLAARWVTVSVRDRVKVKVRGDIFPHTHACMHASQGCQACRYNEGGVMVMHASQGCHTCGLVRMASGLGLDLGLEEVFVFHSKSENRDGAVESVSEARRF